MPTLPDALPLAEPLRLPEAVDDEPGAVVPVEPEEEEDGLVDEPNEPDEEPAAEPDWLDAEGSRADALDEDEPGCDTVDEAPEDEPLDEAGGVVRVSVPAPGVLVVEVCACSARAAAKSAEAPHTIRFPEVFMIPFRFS